MRNIMDRIVHRNANNASAEYKRKNMNGWEQHGCYTIGKPCRKPKRPHTHNKNANTFIGKKK